MRAMSRETERILDKLLRLAGGGPDALDVVNGAMRQAARGRDSARLEDVVELIVARRGPRRREPAGIRL